MYRITKDGAILATLTNVTYIRKQDNGSYGLCEEADAQGLVLNGTVYHVAGLPELPDVETVSVSEISEFAYREEQAERELQTEIALAELSILIAGGGNENV